MTSSAPGGLGLIARSAAPAGLLSAVAAWALPAADPAPLVGAMVAVVAGQMALTGSGGGADALLRPAAAARVWLGDPETGARRVLACATTLALFIAAAMALQAGLVARYRHPGLVLAAFSAGALVAAALALFIAPVVRWLWGPPLRLLGRPTPAAAWVVVATIAGGVTVATGLGHGPSALAHGGLLGLFCVLQGSWALRISRPRM